MSSIEMIELIRYLEWLGSVEQGNGRQFFHAGGDLKLFDLDEDEGKV